MNTGSISCFVGVYKIRALVVSFLSAEPSGYPSVLGYPLISSTSVQIQIAEIGYLDQNGPVTNYALHYAPLTDGSFDDARSVSIEASGRMLFHLNKLRPFTMYRFQIQGINDFGTGPLSPFAEFMTAEDG